MKGFSGSRSETAAHAGLRHCVAVYADLKLCSHGPAFTKKCFTVKAHTLTHAIAQL